MTTTPAMPEHSVAIKQLTMAANQFDCAAATTNDHKKAAEYLQESREIRASIATLQAQPASKCDGNHGGPRCADPECWNDDQPEQPAEVSDAKWDGAEEWMPLAWELCAEENGEESCNELIWTGGPIPEPWGDRWLQYEDEAKRLIELVRKHVPSLRPQAVPMTYDLANEFAREMVKGHKSVEWLVRKVEAHHGITVPAGGEGKHSPRELEAMAHIDAWLASQPAAHQATNSQEGK